MVIIYGVPRLVQVTKCCCRNCQVTPFLRHIAPFREFTRMVESLASMVHENLRDNIYIPFYYIVFTNSCCVAPRDIQIIGWS